MKWTEEQLQQLKKKGFKVTDNQVKEKPKVPKQAKVSVEKRHIETILQVFKKDNKIIDYVEEFRFDTIRKFRFDWYIPELKLGIEYEGIISKRSRHTNMKGYTNDCEKYNLAMTLGYRVLRYTALNYQDIFINLEKIIKDENKQD